MHDPRHLAVNGGPLPLSARQTRPAVTICPSLPRALYRISDPASRRPSPDALRGLPVLVVGREYERRRPSAALILIFGSARLLILILILIFGPTGSTANARSECFLHLVFVEEAARASGPNPPAARARASARLPTPPFWEAWQLLMYGPKKLQKCLHFVCITNNSLHASVGRRVEKGRDEKG